jgi:hypothetical protein
MAYKPDIMDYFLPVVQLGLTATLKRTHNVVHSHAEPGCITFFLSGQARPGMSREVYLHVMQAHGRSSRRLHNTAEPEVIDDALSSLTEEGVCLYLANATRQHLVLPHTATRSAALRLLLPHLPAVPHKTALAYVWQNFVATAARYGDEKLPERDD